MSAFYSSDMEQWQDQGIVLSVRRHGESGAIISALTEGQGRHAGYVRGAQGSKMRGTLELGNIVDVRWSSRVADHLGTFQFELLETPAVHIMQERLKLAALQSACALCDAALPEREAHPGLFHGLRALFAALQSDVWAEAYVMWEVAFLRELGFSLDFSRCAGGGDDGDLAFVSPKTGRAVSRAAGAPYQEKLLKLPAFLRPHGGASSESDVLDGLKLTGYFLEHWAFNHNTQGVPEARQGFEVRFQQRAT